MRNRLRPPDTPRICRICVGYSGGLDSTVLLHLLAAERANSGLMVSAAHVHHGLNPQADAWARHCRVVCRQWQVPFHLRRVSVNRAPRTSLEEEARKARHAAFSALPADVMVLAHHANDQAETLLLQLLRGAGPKGLSAMAALKPLVGAALGPVAVWRPLLGFTRSQLEAYARRHQLAWIEDDSNRDVRFKRNFVRHELMPVLARGFPAPVAALSRAARHQADAAALADTLADMDLAGACAGAGLDVVFLRSLEDARLKNVLRRWIELQPLRSPSEARLLALVRALRQSTNGTHLEWHHEGRVVRRTRSLLHCD